MLILIAGITGNIGAYAAAHGLEKGHQIRGLGRNPDKLSLSTSSSLESFVRSENYWDVPSLDKACAGVDAVICAYSGLPELHLEGQLLLFRAAERAGIKIFLAAGWNYDWRTIQFGEEPIYDGIRTFHQHVRLSSGIRPLHIFSGMLAEVFFGVEGQAGFTPAFGGVWEPRKNYMEFWGDGNGEWCFTTEEDAGRWGIEAVTADGAENGGYITVCSWKSSLNQLKSTYENVRGVQVKAHTKGSLHELEQLAIKEKEALGMYKMWEWHRHWFLLYSLNGTWNLKNLENHKYPGVQATSFEEFLIQHPNI